ncbi:hypothetical protein TNCV_1720731 [Trichonephila clavipes]|nr:hypothetical protein TNCV_1720731 [Trichonephila clavipes]
MSPNTLRVHTDFHAEIVEVEIDGVAIYRPFVEFRRAKLYCHLYGAQGMATSVPLGPFHDEFRGPRSDYVRQIMIRSLAKSTHNYSNLEFEKEKERLDHEFQLEKLRLENKVSVYELTKTVPKFEMKDWDKVLFFTLFERQAKRVSIEKRHWVSIGSFGSYAK